MYLPVVLLLLAAVSVSAEMMDVNKLLLFGLMPSDPRAFWNTLEVAVEYDSSGGRVYTSKVVLLVTKPGEDSAYHTLALLNSTGAFKGSEEPDVTVQGSSTDWELSVIWPKANDGYCRSYMAKVFGEDVNGIEHSVSKQIKLGPPEESLCIKPVHIPDYIENSFPEATHEQQVQILNKLNSIDTNTYKVSNIYKGRVFIASMKDKNFQFHKMNELCKTAGGYLLELEDQDEQWAVRDFLKDIGSYNYYTGGNDVDSEGNFVYYNSKKPMTNVVWASGEPNNSGNEDCVEVKQNGLNDNQCGREHGYICTVPLL